MSSNNDIDAVRAKFKRIAAFRFTASDFKVFADAANLARKEAFLRSEAPDGSKWKPLKPDTILRKSGKHNTTRVKRKNGISGLGTGNAKASQYPTKPLIDTGMMMNATTRSTSDAGYVILARSRGESLNGNDSIASIHDKGSGKIPQRRHWAIYPAARERIMRIINVMFWRHIRTNSK